MQPRLTVIIPSRAQDRQIAFLRRSTGSIRRQSAAGNFAITILVGVDKGCNLDTSVSDSLGVRCVESDGGSQAAALNAAIRIVDDGYVAFLEDDDEWMPDYLRIAISALSHCDFVSSTQAEHDETDFFIKTNDFPTPSGWMMPASILRLVGEFNEHYRFHLDNEWLGRLVETKSRRAHLVEATAPTLRSQMRVRPWLANILDMAAGTCQIVRHGSPYPLVKRLVHSASGMARIASDRHLQEISREEHLGLMRRFGRVPW